MFFINFGEIAVIHEVKITIQSDYADFYFVRAYFIYIFAMFLLFKKCPHSSRDRTIVS